MVVPVAISFVLTAVIDGPPIGPILITDLAVFGIKFALNSAMHSFLAVDWSDRNSVSMNIGFYYMANAGGRLLTPCFLGIPIRLSV